MGNTGFPPWTLWGMGLAAAGALAFITLAFIAQTPRLISRLGLGGARLDLRARSLTGYGLALLLAVVGFFVAGVPLGQPQATADVITNGTVQPGDEAMPAVDGTISPEDEATEAAVAAEVADVATPDTTRVVGTGAMGGALPTATPSEGSLISPTVGIDLAAVSEITATLAAPTQAATLSPNETASPVPTLTPSPTPSPTPTATPTPITGPSAVVGDGTSTLQVRKRPGGEPLWLLYRGDTVLLLPGHAFHGGDQWREVSTVDGVAGWVLDAFLDYGDTTAAGSG